MRQERRHQGVHEEAQALAGDAASTPAQLVDSRQLGVREIMQLQGRTYSRARNLIARGMADLRRGLEARDIDV